MGQLTGPEQGELHELLVGLLRRNQLSRALRYGGLPDLKELSSENDVFREAVDKVISRLSDQYRVIPLVEAVLNELNELLTAIAPGLTYRASKAVPGAL